MAKAYSKDLRIRILKAVDKGESPELVAPRFSVSSRTIYLWQKQRNLREHSDPITKYQKGHSHKINDLENFRSFVLKHSNLTAKEMSRLWGGISVSTINRYLKRLNITHKITYGYINRSEERRKEFIFYSKEDS